MRRAFATRSAEAFVIGIDWLSTVTTIQVFVAVVVMNRAIAIALDWVKRYRTNFSGCRFLDQADWLVTLEDTPIAMALASLAPSQC